MTTLRLSEYQQTQRHSDYRNISLEDILLRDNEEDNFAATSS